MNDSSVHMNAVTIMKEGVLRTTMKHFRISDDPTDFGTVCIQQVSHVQSAFKAAYSCWDYFYEQFIFTAALDESKTMCTWYWRIFTIPDYSAAFIERRHMNAITVKRFVGFVIFSLDQTLILTAWNNRDKWDGLNVGASRTGERCVHKTLFGEREKETIVWEMWEQMARYQVDLK